MVKTKALSLKEKEIIKTFVMKFVPMVEKLQQCETYEDVTNNIHSADNAPNWVENMDELFDTIENYELSKIKE